MKALSLWQPWATLIAREAKRIETRGWPCPPSIIGRPLAIHATRGNDHHWLRGREPFATELAGVDYPLGAIVCVVRVTACEPITPDLCNAIHQRGGYTELAYGDYTGRGRYAWHLADVHTLASPYPARGRQGLWNVPPELAQALGNAHLPPPLGRAT